MWPLKIALEALGGISGTVLRFLSIAGIAAAYTAAVFFARVQAEAGKHCANELQAQIAALKEERRKSDEIERQQATRISDLEQALRQINDEDPISGDGSECRLGAGLMQQLARQYGQDWRGDPAISGSD